MNHWIAATLIGLLATMPVHAEPCNENGVRLQVLGSGGEALVPGRAASGYLVWKDKRARLLVDTGSGVALRFRQSGADVEGLDAVLYTHHHVDHILGMDDLRSLNFFTGRDIPIYATRYTLENIRRVFAYVFESETVVSDIPRVIPREITHRSFRVAGVTVQPVPVLHGDLPILGFRIGKFAYCTDVSHIPEESMALLEGLEVLLLGALRRKPHPTHFSLSQAVDAARRVKARSTYLIHMSHDLGHAQTEAQLPENIRLAYDGLTLTIAE